MKALSIVSIPMFLALRRTLIFFVFLFGLAMGNNQKNVTLSFCLAVALITFGAVVAGYPNFNNNLLGYGLILLNNSFTAISLNIA